MQQLRTEGVIGDLTKIEALLSVAKQYVITDSDWNLLDFASQMQSLTGGDLVFHTLPIQGYATIDGQDQTRLTLPPSSTSSSRRSTRSPPHRPRPGHSRSLVVRPRP